jgi:hypothetical protein
MSLVGLITALLPWLLSRNEVFDVICKLKTSSRQGLMTSANLDGFSSHLRDMALQLTRLELFG